ncbi:MAG: hypothetical protein WBM28_12330 [Burkholderiales bacterium]
MSAAQAETIDFDSYEPGAVPEEWATGVTGKGASKWTIAADAGAPSRPNVLMQSGAGNFPWCVLKRSSIADGFVEVKFKPLRGKEDQAGGVVWRWKDGNGYYVARGNALENNVSLYFVHGGRRITLQYIDAPVAAKAWHVLRVEFAGERIAVALDGKRYIDLRDAHIAGAGAVGVWTKADSVTAFDDFRFGAPSP